MSCDEHGPGRTRGWDSDISLHQNSLLAYILTLHPDRNETQDILQEINVVLRQKTCEFRPGTNFRAWPFQVAYLQTLAHFKRMNRRHRLGFDRTDEAEPALTDLEQPRRALRRWVEKLPNKDRGIVLAAPEMATPTTIARGDATDGTGNANELALPARQLMCVS